MSVSSKIFRGRRRGVVIAALVTSGLLAGCAASRSPTAPVVAAAAVGAPSSITPSDLVPSDLVPSGLAASGEPVPAPPTPSATGDVRATTTTTLASTTTSVAVVEANTDDTRAREALALIAFPWRQRLPGWSMAFLPAQAGLRGLTRVDERRIEIYERDSDTAASLARVIAHELGHAVDVTLNSPTDRERWRIARGVGAGVPWWPANGVSDFDTLAGDFAEAFATWLTGAVSQSRVAPPPDPAALGLLAELATG